MKLPEHLNEGEIIHFRGQMWYVSNKDLYQVSSAVYSEVQWTLINQKKEVLYLLYIREKQKEQWESFWMTTKEIPLSEVQYQDKREPNKWLALEENIPAMEAPQLVEAPQTIQYRNRQYQFHAKNVGKARNDQGIRTVKITWDYLDESKKYNLAVEFWEEDNKFYPEAYHGQGVDQDEFKIVLHPPLRRISPNYSIKHIIFTVLVVAFLLLALFGSFAYFLLGVVLSISFPPLRRLLSKPVEVTLIKPAQVTLIAAIFLLFLLDAFDYFLLGVVPFIFIIGLMLAYIPLAWFISLCVSILCIMVLSLFYAMFWTVGIWFLLGTLLILRYAMTCFDRLKDEHFGFIAWSGVLPTMWIYSSYLYSHYAPRPHESYQLVYTCLMPVVISLICFIMIFMMERLWLNKN